MSMSENASLEIGKLVSGINPDEATRLIVDHIRKTQGYRQDREAYRYWQSLTINEKVDLAEKALNA